MGILDAMRFIDSKARAYDGLCEMAEATCQAVGLPLFYDEGSPLDAEMLEALVSGDGLRRELIKAGWTPPAALLPCECEPEPCDALSKGVE